MRNGAEGHSHDFRDVVFQVLEATADHEAIFLRRRLVRLATRFSGFVRRAGQAIAAIR